MERIQEVEHILGKGVVKYIISEMHIGRIKEIDVKKMAIEMDNGVYGVFTQNQNNNISLVDQI
jgi:hypothetical protein